MEAVTANWVNPSVPATADPTPRGWRLYFWQGEYAKTRMCRHTPSHLNLENVNNCRHQLAQEVIGQSHAGCSSFRQVDTRKTTRSTSNWAPEVGSNFGCLQVNANTKKRWSPKPTRWNVKTKGSWFNLSIVWQPFIGVFTIAECIYKRRRSKKQNNKKKFIAL